MLISDAVFDNLHQFLDLFILLAKLGRDLSGVIPVSQSGIVAGLLVTVLLPVFHARVGVSYERVKLYNLILYILCVLLQTLRLFPSLLLQLILVLYAAVIPLIAFIF